MSFDLKCYMMEIITNKFYYRGVYPSYIIYGGGTRATGGSVKTRSIKNFTVDSVPEFTKLRLNDTI